MVEFRLSKHSRVEKGRIWPKPDSKSCPFRRHTHHQIPWRLRRRCLARPDRDRLPQPARVRLATRYRFRADALGSTLLFIGYSMSDPNIRLLLHRIWQSWEESGHRQDRPRSFAFVTQRNPVQEAVLANWGITTIAPPDGVSPDDGVTRFLLDIRQRIDREK